MKFKGGWAISEQRFLKEKEIRRLRSRASNSARNSRQRRRTRVLEWIVIEIALETGMRVSEIAALNCGDLVSTDRGGSVRVRHGKGNKSRLVRFGTVLKRAIERYLKWKRLHGESVVDSSPLLVSSHTGGNLTTRALQKMFTRVKEAAGIQGHCFHDLRHTYASFLYHASGKNARLVQKQLGHASIQTTQVYVDVLDGETEKAVNQLYSLKTLPTRERLP